MRARRRSLLRVAAGLLWRRGRVLLMQRHRDSAAFPGKWEFPGGKLRPGETPRKALARELEEELAVRARAGPLAARYRHRYPTGQEVELWFFEVRRCTGRLPSSTRLRAERRAEQIRWVRPADLPGYDLLEGDARVVELLAAKAAKS